MTAINPTTAGALVAGVLVVADVSLLLDAAPAAGWLAVPVAVSPVLFAGWLQHRARAEQQCRHCVDGADPTGRPCLYCAGTRKFPCPCPDQRKQFAEVA